MYVLVAIKSFLRLPNLLTVMRFVILVMNKMLNVIFVVTKGLGVILVKCILQTAVLNTERVNVAEDKKFDFNLVIISRGFFLNKILD